MFTVRIPAGLTALRCWIHSGCISPHFARRLLFFFSVFLFFWGGWGVVFFLPGCLKNILALLKLNPVIQSPHPPKKNSQGTVRLRNLRRWKRCRFKVLVSNKIKCFLPVEDELSWLQTKGFLFHLILLLPTTSRKELAHKSCAGSANKLCPSSLCSMREAVVGLFQGGKQTLG